ncbi:DUF389 domain-containing protein [Echinicola jeungdonensis]|uniref:DUF389 domain-containing protein n=1 Tax=Echinicola jeungdonensis TaxID=709343 RepID=A0ABV5J8F3_9BACT|nr:DUF389 domain-containing protein [Echinicola jeungdonensis]MDN3669989.1 DUF389 domain-containing protein [Echinicola jeungdonensis]
MKGITLLFDESLAEEVEDKIVPLFGELLKGKIPFSLNLEIALEEDDFLVTYLSDDQLKALFPKVIENEWQLGFLPHPKMTHARQGFGVGSSIEKAAENILKTDEVKRVDALMVNGRPVFNTVVIGESLSVMYGSAELSAIKRLWGKFKSFFKMFRRMHLHPYSILIQKEGNNENGEGKKEEKIETAALGMVVVEHGKSSLLSRRILEDSFVNDGMMHNIVLSPHSVFGLLEFTIKSFFRSTKNSKLPPFAAHIKTKKLIVQSPEPINLSVDGVFQSTKEVELEVVPKVLKIVPGRYLDTQAEANNKEIFKTQMLPRGELRDELLSGPLPYINHATTEEFKDLFTVLRENSQPTSSYLVLMVLSTVLATFGLFANSTPVIIGAMILAPLMAPIISLSMGVLRQDQHLIKNSLQSVGFGLLLGYLFAVFITWLTPLKTLNSEIVARIRPNLLDLGVAAASGVAGAYAHSKKEIAKTLAGVAIAVALVPPLAVSGIGLGWLNWQVFSGALLLLVTNLAGMVLAASLTFLLLGFSPFHLAKKGLMWSLVLVLGVSTPLAFGFSKMVHENKIIQQLSGYQLNEKVTIREVNVRQLSPLRLAVTLVADGPLDEKELLRVKRKVETMLGEEVELEITTGVKM